MPVVFRQDGYRFHFFSDEGTPIEPIHIHVEKAGCEAKFWLGEEIEEAYNYGFKRREVAMIKLMIRARRRDILDAWHGHFDQG